MSFVILLFIVVMLYVCLKKYSNLFSVVGVISGLLAATTVFLVYGFGKLQAGPTFIVVNTEINSFMFWHFCAAWYIADLFCAYRAIRLYREYVKVNAQ